MSPSLEPLEVTSSANSPFFCPTPAQIRAACAEIQQEWTPEVRASRRLRCGGFDELRLHLLPDHDHYTRAG